MASVKQQTQPQALMKWTTLALAVPSLTACGGAQSALNPAGPMAQDVANVWWWMFGFAALVWLTVATLWVYAMLRRSQPHSAEQAKRINRRWVIGGGIVLPSVSIAVLLAFGLPTGRSMLPLPVEGEQPLRIRIVGHQCSTGRSAGRHRGHQCRCHPFVLGTAAGRQDGHDSRANQRHPP